MFSSTDTLTPAEAAVVAGVSVRDVHRMIDEHILPERYFDTSESRSFKSQACVFISFYLGTADRLTPEERQRSIALASKVCDWSKGQNIIQDDVLTIDFSHFSKAVEERYRRLQEARRMVVSDPEILSGTPVIRGTRVPAYQVASEVARGTSRRTILDAYPSLKPDQIDLAVLYAEATPQRGRPRQSASLPAGAVVISRRKVAIKRKA